MIFLQLFKMIQRQPLSDIVDEGKSFLIDNICSLPSGQEEKTVTDVGIF